MTRYAAILLAVLVAGAALTVRLCRTPGSSTEGPGGLTSSLSDLAGDPLITGVDSGPPFDGWCAYSVALGRPHEPRARAVREYDGLTYHLCGAQASGGCGAMAMWENCGELLRADARRQWLLLSLH